MNTKIKRIGLLSVLTLCVAFSAFAQTSGSDDYRRQDGRNRSENVYRDRSDRRNRIRSRRSLSFWSILLQLLIRNPSDYDRRRNGRSRY